MQIVIYEPFQHFIPTGKGWSKGFKQLGHEPFELPSVTYSILDLDQEIDILVLFGPGETKCNDIQEFKKRYPKCKIVYLCSYYEEWFSKILDCVDLWVGMGFKQDILRDSFTSRGSKFAFIYLAADEDIFYPKDIVKQFEVSFVGQFGIRGHGDRDEKTFLFPVIDKGYKGFYGAFSYKVNYPPVPHSVLNDVYNLSKINLNFHYQYEKEEFPKDANGLLDFNGRVFEIAMSGNFQLCDLAHINGVGFDNSIAIGDKSNWMDLIEHYLKHDDERIAMGKKSREVALTKHTWKNRMEDVIKNLGL